MHDPFDYPEHEEGDFVSGIFNYCDRWCERCSMTTRCRLYAGESMDDALGTYDDEDDEEEEELAEDEGAIADEELDGEIFEEEPDFLAALEAQIGDEESLPDVDFADIDDDELDEDDEAREKHPCSVESMRYLRLCHEWLKDHRDGLREDRGIDLMERLRGPVDFSEGPEQLKQALAAMEWDHTQIHVKLQRALGSRQIEQRRPADPDWPSDANGSAKVALLGIDRSLAAWAVLCRHLAEQQAAIFEIQVCLDGVRRLAEREFPQARAFKRPGFEG